ncbi:hypothetical protein NE237_021169 [Protea cynaroides]|uniref:Uncharacterized protein n=1 Tax=Protea cynaroides TaxID=273540 RepID=A0A9Q0H8M1_9MAGN|nr:hypothetical protein NE237_021169 [Protea cynaroides]
MIECLRVATYISRSHEAWDFIITNLFDTFPPLCLTALQRFHDIPYLAVTLSSSLSSSSPGRTTIHRSNIADIVGELVAMELTLLRSAVSLKPKRRLDVRQGEKLQPTGNG